ncbi:MAG: gfo/Idh/MocA family oxidoreductase [Gammaproteobacteria bacterium]|nr:MAG: gfo/Idh/MocA family oxidoreductase [Gammaproteobacteria bacterium]
MINIGLIGYGYWGPNLARNFNNNPDFNLKAICDFSDDRVKHAATFYQQATVTNNADDLFNGLDLDAIAISTPVSTHFDLAHKALSNGKHVWLEKPMTESVEQAEQLIELADKNNLKLLIDHTLVYTGSIIKVKELMDKGDLGDLMYYDSTRLNLGLFQQDVDVIWDLAPHELSVMDYLMPYKKMAVSATGSSYYGKKIVPKAMLTIYMENEVIAHINCSWVSPVKVRQTMIGGTSKMVLFDDNEPSEKIKIYDKGVDLFDTKEALYKLKVQYRVGDMYAPRLDTKEALALETEHFADCILNNAEPITGGKTGLEVVKVLVASKESLKLRGAPVEL